jgi:hypothetical protein
MPRYKNPPEGYIDVGRTTIYGNPIRVGQNCRWCGKFHQYAVDTLSCYEEYLNSRMFVDERFRDAVLLLKGKKLWCPGCALDSTNCHARLLEIACKSTKFK